MRQVEVRQHVPAVSAKKSLAREMNYRFTVLMEFGLQWGRRRRRAQGWLGQNECDAEWS